jgi:hypothetical protein
MKKTFIAITAFILSLLPLAAQTITVDSPKGGETLVRGQPWQIAWTATHVSQNVRIVLIKAAGPKFGVIQSPLAPGASPWGWTIGQTDAGIAPAGSYKIRVITLDGTIQGVSKQAFTISDMKVIEKRPIESLPPISLLLRPQLAVTAINLVRNASGYGIIFGYKNVGKVALPKRHELPVKPDYRVLIDGREIDKGDLFIPESPPAGPGWELTTHSGGFINFPVNEPRPWYIGKEITIILNERNVLNMGSVSKISSLLPMALTVGYDLAFAGPVTIDWSANTAHLVITKVGSNPENSKHFTLYQTIRYYHTNTVHSGARVTIADGPYTDNRSKEFPLTGPFPLRVDIPMEPSPYYDLEFHIYAQERDQFDERNDALPRTRFERPGIPVGPRIHAVSFSTRADSRGNPTQLRTVITLLNEADHVVGGLRLVLNRDGSKAEEWKEIALAGGQKQLYINYGPLPESYPPAYFQVYLYDNQGKLIDSRSEIE